MIASRTGSLLEIDLLHGVRDRRRLAGSDLVDVVHAVDYLAPYRVLAGEAGAAPSVEADEELAVGAVGILRARRADGAALVGLLRELGRKVGIGGASLAGALGVA